MKVRQIFNKIIERGIKSDVRGKKGIKAVLDQSKKEYDGLAEADQPV